MVVQLIACGGNMKVIHSFLLYSFGVFLNRRFKLTSNLLKHLKFVFHTHSFFKQI